MKQFNEIWIWILQFQSLIATVEPVFLRYGLMNLVMIEYHERLQRYAMHEPMRTCRKNLEASDSDDDDDEVVAQWDIYPSSSSDSSRLD